MNFTSSGNLMMTPMSTKTRISREFAKKEAISMIWTRCET